ncbi:MAG: cobalamin-dependent protein [Hydrogenophaga sp.]|nr:cobalamin-dependent protein [Hydrogenophaga sp.]
MLIDDQRFHAYLADLVAGRREACIHHVDALLAQGATARELYVDLFQASLYEVGHRWETGEVSVATEHVATAITEELLGRVFPQVARRAPVGHRAVVSCAADEFHQIGGRIVADTLEGMGWDVDFVGAGASMAELVDCVMRAPADLVAVSVSVDAHLARMAQTVRAVRAADPRVPIAVGGRALGHDGAARLASLGLPGVHHVPTLEALEALLTLEAFRP